MHLLNSYLLDVWGQVKVKVVYCFQALALEVNAELCCEQLQSKSLEP